MNAAVANGIEMTQMEPPPLPANEARPGPSACRPASRDDRARVCATLAAAFHDDPVMTFIYPDARDRRRGLPRLFAILYEGDGARGARDMTQGGEAASLWRAPGQGHLGLYEKVRHGLPWLNAARLRLPRALAVSAASDANHPREPHWYLHIVGCAPADQGRGFGRAVIAPGLARADADGVPAYVETANARNLPLYQSLGFAVTHRWRVPNGPDHWSLSRPIGG